MAEFPTNVCGAICLLNLLAIRCLQLWCQPMGPLCLWQCFLNGNESNNLKNTVASVSKAKSSKLDYNSHLFSGWNAPQMIDFLSLQNKMKMNSKSETSKNQSIRVIHNSYNGHLQAVPSSFSTDFQTVFFCPRTLKKYINNKS